MVIKCFCERAAFPIGTKHHLSYRQGWGSICHMLTIAAWKLVPRERSQVDIPRRAEMRDGGTHAVTMVSAPSSSFSCSLTPEPHHFWQEMFLPMPCLSLTLIINSSNLLRLGWKSFYNLCTGITFLKYVPICFFILAFPYSPVFLFFIEPSSLHSFP